MTRRHSARSFISAVAALILVALPAGAVLPPGGTFTDDDASEHESAIDVLASRGITKGCAPDLYCPDRPVTRAEMATFLVRVLELEPAGSAGFDDISTSEHAAAIDALAASGITKGCSDTSFCPHHVVTRGQMASFLIRALGG